MLEAAYIFTQEEFSHEEQRRFIRTLYRLTHEDSAGQDIAPWGALKLWINRWKETLTTLTNQQEWQSGHERIQANNPGFHSRLGNNYVIVFCTNRANEVHAMTFRRVLRRESVIQKTWEGSKWETFNSNIPCTVMNNVKYIYWKCKAHYYMLCKIKRRM